MCFETEEKLLIFPAFRVQMFVHMEAFLDIRMNVCMHSRMCLYMYAFYVSICEKKVEAFVTGNINILMWSWKEIRTFIYS